MAKLNMAYTTPVHRLKLVVNTNRYITIYVLGKGIPELVLQVRIPNPKLPSAKAHVITNWVFGVLSKYSETHDVHFGAIPG